MGSERDFNDYRGCTPPAFKTALKKNINVQLDHHHHNTQRARVFASEREVVV
jgi:hypothetical protein